jgi:phospholipid/cholesterol/gamma-HCH transport system substrate-binding protein
MNTQPLNAARIFVVAAFALTCFGLMLYLWNAFGGAVPLKPKAYRVTLALPEADLLAEQADVRISGVHVGTVVRTEAGTDATDPNRKDALLEIDRRYAPLHGDIRAIIRRKSLAGEEFLELTPGSRAAPVVPDGGRLPSASVAPSVKIDELLRTFDPATRRNFDIWIQQQGLSVGDRGADLSAALGALPAFETDLTGLVTTLNRQSRAVRAAVRETGTVFDALSRSSADLRGLMVNGRRATDAFAAQADGLAGTFRALPAFEAESQRLLHKAEAFRKNTDPVLTALRPGFREFGAAAQGLPATAREFNGLMHGVRDLNPAAERGLPAAVRFLDEVRPFTAEFAPFLAQLAPILDYIEPNADTLNTLFANLASATQATTAGYGSAGAGVHYARTSVAMHPDSLAQFPRRQSTTRINPYDSGRVKFSAKQPFSVFDDGNCGQPLAFPQLGPPDAAAGLDAEMVQRIRHFVLNDDKPVAVPCVPDRIPGGPAFTHVQALSQTPRGAP